MTTSVFLNNDRTMPLLGLAFIKQHDAVEAEERLPPLYRMDIAFWIPLLHIRTKNSSDVELPNAVFQEKIFLSQPRSGTMLSVLVM